VLPQRVHEGRAADGVAGHLPELVAGGAIIGTQEAIEALQGGLGLGDLARGEVGGDQVEPVVTQLRHQFGRLIGERGDRNQPEDEGRKDKDSGWAHGAGH
jgi:hypothetical protein